MVAAESDVDPKAAGHTCIWTDIGVVYAVCNDGVVYCWLGCTSEGCTVGCDVCGETDYECPT